MCSRKIANEQRRESAMSTFESIVRAKLDQLQFLPSMLVLMAAPGKTPLPVFVAAHDTAEYLGHADTHADASALGLAHGYTCDFTSVAFLTNEQPPRKFYALHGGLVGR